MDYKPLPMGIENFEEIITDGYYYVDKTLFIKDLWDKKGKVNLFTRPRRFGKSLNVSMLQCFFEKTEEDHSHLFEGLKIMDADERYASEMGKYPVVKFTFKSAKKSNYDSAMFQMKEELKGEFLRHDYLLDSGKVKESEKRIIRDIINEEAVDDRYSICIKLLTKCLERHHGEKAIVLVDEYDVPLEAAYFNGFYDKMVEFVRSLFESGLKTNDSLQFAVLTGCLRISKESIFTGLNNPNVISILSYEYGEYFGFTDGEVKQAFAEYNQNGKMDEAREWYNGYLFGKTNVYNPWSVIQYLKDAASNPNHSPTPYWSNTSSNDIVRRLITVANDEAKGEIENLIRGGSIYKPVHEDVVYDEIEKNMDNLWNFLFFTGYLKKTGERREDVIKYLTLEIPNKEVLYIYKTKISEWFQEKTSFADPRVLIDAITEGDADTLMDELNKRLMDAISYFDSEESFYHGFLLGILSNVQGFAVQSNRESGTGRTDIFLKDKGVRKRGVVFELKTVGDKDEADEKCEEALRQIEEKRYAHGLEAEGYQNIMKYGVAFRGKECLVKVACPRNF